MIELLIDLICYLQDPDGLNMRDNHGEWDHD